MMGNRRLLIQYRLKLDLVPAGGGVVFIGISFRFPDIRGKDIVEGDFRP
jgi:hypothetical protein